MSVLFNSLPPSIDTLNDFFFAKEKAPKTIYDDPSTLLFRFLQQSPRIRNNIVCSFRSSSSKLTWISYDNWASIYKSAVEAKFIKITNLWRSFFSSKHFDFSELWQSGLLQLNPDSHYFSLEEAQDAFFAFVAHSLWIEIHSILAWSLTQYDDASLKYLLHSKYMFCESSLSSNVFIFGQVFAHDTSYLTPFINLPLRANPIDPMSLYFFLGSRHLINKTGIPENGMAKSMSGSLRGPNPELQLSDFPPKDIISALSHTQRYRIPFKQRYTWKKDALSGLFHSTLSAKRTLSILCRWFAYHMIHGSGYGFWLSGSNLEGPFPPMDRSLSIPIQASRMKTPHQIKLPLEYQALGVKSNDMHLDTGTVLSNTNEIRDPKTRQLVGLELEFYRYNAFLGCQTAAGVIHWLLRALNIPSKRLGAINVSPDNIFTPDVLTTTHHGGIAAFLPGLRYEDGLYLYHMDVLYAEPSHFSPIIDPINFFVTQGEYNSWFAPPHLVDFVANFTVFAAAHYGQYATLKPSGLAWRYGFRETSYAKSLKSFGPNVLGMSQSSALYDFLNEVYKRRIFGLKKGIGIPHGYTNLNSIGFIPIDTLIDNTNKWGDDRNGYLKFMNIPTDQQLLIKKSIFPNARKHQNAKP